MTHAAVHVLGILSAAVVAFTLFLTLCAIAGCVLSSRISRAEERRCLARASRFDAMEPDPIESYPILPIPATPPAPIIVVDGPLPGIANPLTNQYMTTEIRQ